MQIDLLLSRVTRQIGRSWLGVHVAEVFRRYYVPFYRGRADARVVIDNFDGDLKLKVDRSSYLGGMLYWRGYQTIAELRVLRRLLKPDMVYADIGANQGEYALFAAKRLTNGAVLAFEPVPALYEQLVDNVRLNNFTHVRTFNFGLFSHEDVLQMYTSTDVVIHNSFNEGLASIFASDYRKDVVATAQLKAFDQVFPTLGLKRLDLMKVDVEGAELHVLQGAEEMLRQYRPLLMLEVNEPAFAAAGYTTRELRQFLEQRGYRVALIDDHGDITYDIGEQLPALCNILCQYVDNPELQ